MGIAERAAVAAPLLSRKLEEHEVLWRAADDLRVEVEMSERGAR